MRKIANGKNMLGNLVTIKPTNFILGIAVAIWEWTNIKSTAQFTKTSKKNYEGQRKTRAPLRRWKAYRHRLQHKVKRIPKIFMLRFLLCLLIQMILKTCFRPTRKKPSYAVVSKGSIMMKKWNSKLLLRKMQIKSRFSQREKKDHWFSYSMHISKIRFLIFKIKISWLEEKLTFILASNISPYSS